MFLTRHVILVFVFIFLLFGGCLAMSSDDSSVDIRFRGEWVSSKSACTSELRLKLDAHLVTFINGSDRQEYGQLEQCYSCMGKDTPDFVWLTTDAMGDSPFTIFLDGTKKQVALAIDFTNDAKLGRRFPFGAAKLKKCK